MTETGYLRTIGNVSKTYSMCRNAPVVALRGCTAKTTRTSVKIQEQNFYLGKKKGEVKPEDRSDDEAVVVLRPTHLIRDECDQVH